MKIVIVKGNGQGLTTKSAFDNALADAGIADYNIIKLSSIIPPNSILVKQRRFKQKPNTYGDRLYVVMADKTIIEGTASVGVGWTQEADGRGLFVEFDGANENDVKEQIFEGLGQMQARREREYKSLDYVVNTIKCKDYYACTIVVAVFKSETWGDMNGRN